MSASRRSPRIERERARTTLRLDRAGDAARLYQLAALNGCRLAPGPFVVADVDGRVVAARPLRGGAVVADPRGSKDLLPLLELRARQLRLAQAA